MQPPRCPYHTHSDDSSANTWYPYYVSKCRSSHYPQFNSLRGHVCGPGRGHASIREAEEIQVDTGENSQRHAASLSFGLADYDNFDYGRCSTFNGTEFNHRFLPLLILTLLSQVLGQSMVRYLQSLHRITLIPDNIEFHPPAFPPDHHRSLILSWVSTSSSLIPVDLATYVLSDDGTPSELPLWVLYFTVVLVRSRFGSAAPPSTIETRTILRHQLMIEAPTSGEVVEEVPSFHWFQPHTLLTSSSGPDECSKVEPPELGCKFSLLLPTLELKPVVTSRAPDVVRSPTPPAGSLHLADYIDGPKSEIADPSQPKGPTSTLSLGMTSMATGLSCSERIPDAPGPALVRSFERISGRRRTPPIQFWYCSVDRASKIRPSLSVLTVTPTEPPSLGEYDFNILSQFPLPPKSKTF